MLLLCGGDNHHPGDFQLVISL
uniref:Uncharacterized protein n=1 Tax=Rhizophora mucronata TaxID=61149 RepID=A0A2P2PBL5_RHIMU